RRTAGYTGSLHDALPISLHFERFADGFGAIGAVPFGAEDSATARLVMEHADTTSDTVIVALPVARRRVPRERLHVSPEFAEPPRSEEHTSELQSRGPLVC